MRRRLPIKRRNKFLARMREKLVGFRLKRSHGAHQFEVMKAHSRFIWNNFYA